MTGGLHPGHTDESHCTAAFGAHEIIARAVPAGATVLDVGCAGGHLGAILAARGCVVDGLDRVLRVPAAVQANYRDLASVDLNEAAALPWPTREYDAVVCADVLEHVLDPEAVLAQLAGRLRPDGLAVVSLPNVANLSVRLPLLLGRFEYTPSGILDVTHLHLYTVKSARRLVESAGLRPFDVLFGSARFGNLLNRHPVAGRLLGGALGYNIVVLARQGVA